VKTLAIRLAALSALLLAACGGSNENVGSSSGAVSDDTSSKHCSSNSDCATGDYCAHSDSASCGGSGTCTALPFACPYICEPVCGCDGKTYDNYCDAQQAKTSVAFTGFCEEHPSTGCWGQSGGQTCSPATAQADCNPGATADEGYKQTKGPDSNLYCLSALSAPSVASCISIPDGCDKTGKVCGRDGNTYDSECDAWWIGRVATASKGACPAASPRTTQPESDAGSGDDGGSQDAASQDAADDAGSQDSADGGSQDGQDGNGEARSHEQRRAGTALTKVLGWIGR
jgi:hypothetical protein